MARASYQNLNKLSFGKPVKQLTKPKNVRRSFPTIAEPTPVIIPKPEGRTILKLRTPLS